LAWELTQFSRIHDNVDMPDEDKFQYLIQVTMKGLRAQEIVDSFPPTVANYSKVTDSLKSMFRQEELPLTYVRELLVLVVKNATSMKGGLNCGMVGLGGAHNTSCEADYATSARGASMIY